MNDISFSNRITYNTFLKISLSYLANKMKRDYLFFYKFSSEVMFNVYVFGMNVLNMYFGNIDKTHVDTI